MGIGLPPILHSENTELKKRVGLPCLLGEKKIALCISEPTAGSDVANLKTTAVEDGDYYIVNGMKKWITCGMIADFFTVAVRTGGEGSGMMGIELLLVERGEGVVTRPMDCMGAKGSGTAFVEFYNVRYAVQAVYFSCLNALLTTTRTVRFSLHHPHKQSPQGEYHWRRCRLAAKFCY